MKPRPADNEAIKEAARILNAGGLVAFPTETVYGLGADAMNHRAVAKIFEAKERPWFDPLIVHIAEIGRLSEVALRDLPGLVELTGAFWPGPLTLVLPKTGAVPDIVTAGLPTVAVRMPRHRVALRLIGEAGCPVAAPSANRFGRLSPTRAEHVAAQMGERVGLILDGGACEVGLESTILKLEPAGPVLLRPGGLPLEHIEKIVGPVRDQSAAAREHPEAPGQLLSHYSPRTPLEVVENASAVEPVPENAGLLAFTPPGNPGRFAAVEVLSREGDLVEAASRLFSCLHRLDDLGLDIIYAERVPEQGLGRAIMNRLNRARRSG